MEMGFAMSKGLEPLPLWEDREGWKYRHKKRVE